MTCILCGQPAVSWLCDAHHAALLAQACREIIDAAINARRKGEA